MKLCWFLTTYQSHNAASAHWRPSLVSDKHVPACRRLQAPVQWCGFHAARGESEWCIVLLLWCLAAQTVIAPRHPSSCWRLLLFSVPRVRKSTELLWHKTPDFTPDVVSQQTRPQFCRLQITESLSECVCQKQQAMSNIVEELWLLTDWLCFE